MTGEAAIRLRGETVGSHLDERGRRLLAAAEVRSSVEAVLRSSFFPISKRSN
jgi:hypothetical protein